jgi:hypothetical protein
MQLEMATVLAFCENSSKDAENSGIETTAVAILVSRAHGCSGDE